MGRLEVQIRHGHDGGGWGAVVALILFIALAACGAAHKQLGAAAHMMITAVEVIAWTLAGLVILAVATGLGWLALKVRRAVRARRFASPLPTSVVRLGPGHQYGPVPPGDDRLALDRFRPAGSWPLPGQWDRIWPPPGDGDDRRRYS